MVTEGDSPWGSEHTIQYPNDLQNRTPETSIILLTNVTPINSIKKVLGNSKEEKENHCPTKHGI